MPETEQQLKEEVKGMEWAKIISDRYGPYAFGVASLLMIWFIIVGPELVRNQVSYEEQRVITKQMREIVMQQLQIAELMRDTSKTLSDLRTHVSEISKKN